MYLMHQPLFGFITGLLALAAAWYGGERFLLRQVRMLSNAAQRLAQGDLRARTGLANERGEFGELARTLDSMAEVLEKRAKESQRNETNLLHRSLQQTVVGALGQFALASSDLDALLNQAVLLIAQTLELEYTFVLELQPDAGPAVLRTGVQRAAMSTAWPRAALRATASVNSM